MCVPPTLGSPFLGTPPKCHCHPPQATRPSPLTGATKRPGKGESVCVPLYFWGCPPPQFWPFSPHFLRPPPPPREPGRGALGRDRRAAAGAAGVYGAIGDTVTSPCPHVPPHAPLSPPYPHVPPNKPWCDHIASCVPMSPSRGHSGGDTPRCPHPPPCGDTDVPTAPVLSPPGLYSALCQSGGVWGQRWHLGTTMVFGDTAVTRDEEPVSGGRSRCPHCHRSVTGPRCHAAGDGG